jgi:hypothetical protein
LQDFQGPSYLFAILTDPRICESGCEDAAVVVLLVCAAAPSKFASVDVLS